MKKLILVYLSLSNLLLNALMYVIGLGHEVCIGQPCYDNVNVIPTRK